MDRNPFLDNDQPVSSTPKAKKELKRFKLKKEFRDAVITLHQEKDNFIAAFENSEGNHAKGATRGMAVGNLYLKNSEPAE